MLSTQRQPGHFPSIQNFLILSCALSLRARAQGSDDGSAGSDDLGLGNVNGNQLPGNNAQAPSDGDSNKTLYLIILVVVVVLGVGVAVLVMMRRRKRLAQTSRARLVSDMEAARAQHGLTSWRVTGNWHASSAAGSSIPLSPTTTGRPRAQQQVTSGRVEGLNENGEAPPPYSPPANDAGKEIFLASDARRGSGTTTTETELGSPTEQPKKSEDEEGIQRPEQAHRR